MVWIDQSFDKYVRDYQTDYLDTCGKNFENGFHCETIPKLNKWSFKINSLKDLNIKTLTLDYHFNKNNDKIFKFLQNY